LSTAEFVGKKLFFKKSKEKSQKDLTREKKGGKIGKPSEETGYRRRASQEKS